MNLNSQLISRCLLSFGVVTGIIWVASRTTFFADSISSAFLSVALFSIFLILIRTRFLWIELAGVGIVSGLIYWLDIIVLGYKYTWPVVVSCVGMAALVVLALRAVWSRDSERRWDVLILCAAFLFVASEWSANYFLEWGELVRPKTLDLYLYSFDASLGIQPAIAVGQMFVRFPIFAILSQIIYLALPVAIGLAFAGCVIRNRENAIPALVAFLITGPVGACFYMMFPALGPTHILHGNFPWQPLTMEQARRLFLEPITVPGPRNAIPSLHAAWIFLVFWFARRLSIAEKIGAAIFVFFTLSATLGTGEHYFIDLVVAVPFSVFMLAVTQALCGKWKNSLWTPAIAGLGLTLLWFALLRYANRIFWVSLTISWTICAVTVLVCWRSVRPLWEPQDEQAEFLEANRATRTEGGPG